MLSMFRLCSLGVDDMVRRGKWCWTPEEGAEEMRPRREREDKPGLVEVDSALHAVVSSAEKSWARMRRAEELVIWSDRISGEASEGRRKYRLRLLVLSPC